MAIIWLSHGVEEWAAEWHQDENVAGKPFGFGTVTLATLVISDANLDKNVWRINDALKACPDRL